MLSARDEEIDTLMGLDAGADDYLDQAVPAAGAARPDRGHAAALRHPGPGRGRVGHRTGTGGRRHADTAAPRRAPRRQQTTGGWLSHNGLRINSDMWLVDLDGAPLAARAQRVRPAAGDHVGQPSGHLQGHPARFEPAGATTPPAATSATPTGGRWRSTANWRKLNDPVASPRYIETVRGVGYRLADSRR